MCITCIDAWHCIINNCHHYTCLRWVGMLANLFRNVVKRCVLCDLQRYTFNVHTCWPHNAKCIGILHNLHAQVLFTQSAREHLKALLKQSTKPQDKVQHVVKLRPWLQVPVILYATSLSLVQWALSFLKWNWL